MTVTAAAICICCLFRFNAIDCRQEVTSGDPTFQAPTKLAFNGTPATIVSATATQIVTTVPTGATNGHISITPAGPATSFGTFNVT